MESKSYTLVLKSKDRYLPNGIQNNVSVNNAYYTSVSQIFRRIGGILGVNMCKLEFVGIDFTGTNNTNAFTGI